MKHKYSNPRIEAVIEDWPSGSKRVTAKFWVETDAKRGQRAIRETTGAPKKLTFARQMRIVDGDDGRIYIAEMSSYGHITFMQGNMKFHEETVFPQDDGFSEIARLFEA